MRSMSAFKESVRPALSTNPPRLATRPTRPSKALATSGEPQSASSFASVSPFFPPNPKSTATATKPLSTLLCTQDNASQRAGTTRSVGLTKAPITQQRRQVATTSKTRSQTVALSVDASQTSSQDPSTPIDSNIVSEEPVTNPKLPVYSYASFKPTPMVRYIRTESEANKALESITTGPLGFDMEWKVAYRRQVTRPLAVVQLTDGKTIWIVQTSAMKGVFPKKLKELLEDSTIVKTGVNVRGDAKKLFSDYKVKIQNVAELSWLSRAADPELRGGGKVAAKTLISLQKLTAIYLEKDLMKDEARTSNWEAKLSKEQLDYASNDVHSSYILYKYFVQLAKEHKRGLIAHTFTLNVNSKGDVVADIETPEYEEAEDAEPAIVESQTDETPTSSQSPFGKPAFASSKPSKSKTLALASTLQNASTVSSAPVTKSTSTRKAINTKNPIAKERTTITSPTSKRGHSKPAKDSPNDVLIMDNIAMEVEHQRPYLFSKSQGQLPSGWKGLHTSATSESKFIRASVPKPIVSRPPDIIELSDSESEMDTDEELANLAKDFASIRLSDATRQPFTTKQHPRAPPTAITRGRLVVTSAISVTKQSKLQTNQDPAESRVALSKTMAFAMGIREHFN